MPWRKPGKATGQQGDHRNARQNRQAEPPGQKHNAEDMSATRSVRCVLPRRDRCLRWLRRVEASPHWEVRAAADKGTGYIGGPVSEHDLAPKQGRQCGFESLLEVAVSAE